MFQRLKHQLLTFTVLLFTQQTFAQQFWQKAERSVNERYQLAYGRTFSLDTALLSQYIHQQQGAFTLLLPSPNGEMLEFICERNNLLPKELQDKYANIHTFNGHLASNKTISAKFDLTPQGFHAQVYDGAQSFRIDPQPTSNTYIVFYKKDIQSKREMPCGVTTMLETEADSETEIGIATGMMQKKYRLALSCTYEYANAVTQNNPTKASVLAAMVTTANRVNGIYERELGITLQLVSNNDTLIFLTSSDPFTNNDADAMLDQNRTTINNRIGINNYDIGHVFSTGGGGLASIESICTNGKAEGVTGSQDPYGDPFDVDYVAHEMGHQLGAEHSMNYCDGDNENAQTAFEPGSGSTIMGYAGICGNEDLQENSNDYFHPISKREIINILNASSCGTVLNTVTEIPDFYLNQTYTIPASTPFELDAPNVTADFYNWHQWNRGNFRRAEATSATFTTGPTFRSYPAKTDAQRTFPVLDSILRNNTSFVGERLPSVTRNLRFILEVRNQNGNWGLNKTSADTVNINVFSTGNPFAITAPNGNENVNIGNNYEVKWNVAGTNIAPINTSNVDIYLSVDGGRTFPLPLSLNVPNTGSATIMIPSNIGLSNTARIKIKGSNNIFFDISNANFKLVNGSNSISKLNLDDLVNIYPNPANYIIKLDVKNAKTKIDINIYNNLGQKIWSGQAQTNYTINTSNFASGMYHLHIIDTDTHQSNSKKIIIQH